MVLHILGQPQDRMPKEQGAWLFISSILTEGLQPPGLGCSMRLKISCHCVLLNFPVSQTLIKFHLDHMFLQHTDSFYIAH